MLMAGPPYPLKIARSEGVANQFRWGTIPEFPPVNRRTYFTRKLTQALAPK